MNSFKIIILIVICQLFVFKSGASENNANLNHVLSALSKITKSTAEFTESKNYSLLKDEIKTSGVLEYRAPDLVSKKTLKPEKEYFKVSGNSLYYKKSDGKEYDLILGNYPLVEAFVEAYRSVLSGNLNKLSIYYSVEFLGNDKQWFILLKPKNEDAQEYVVKITFEGHENQIDKVITEEAGGDSTIMVIKNSVKEAQ